MQQKQPQKVRCNECSNKIVLWGNKENIMCKISNIIEPMNELWLCDDFKPEVKSKLQ